MALCMSSSAFPDTSPFISHGPATQSSAPPLWSCQSVAPLSSVQDSMRVHFLEGLNAAKYISATLTGVMDASATFPVDSE